MSTERNRKNHGADQVRPKDLGTSSDRAMFDAPRGPNERGSESPPNEATERPQGGGKPNRGVHHDPGNSRHGGSDE